jgi:hypothetical protein
MSVYYSVRSIKNAILPRKSERNDEPERKVIGGWVVC